MKKIIGIFLYMKFISVKTLKQEIFNGIRTQDNILLLNKSNK